MSMFLSSFLYFNHFYNFFLSLFFFLLLPYVLFSLTFIVLSLHSPISFYYLYSYWFPGALSTPPSTPILLAFSSFRAFSSTFISTSIFYSLPVINITYFYATILSSHTPSLPSFYYQHQLHPLYHTLLHPYPYIASSMDAH